MNIFIKRNPVGNNGVLFRGGPNGGGMTESTLECSSPIKILGNTGMESKEAESWKCILG